MSPSDRPRRQKLRAGLAIGAAIVAAALLAFMVARGDDDGDAGSAGSGGTSPPPGRACTLIGCGQGVRVDLSELPSRARSARVCVDRVCGRAQPVRRPGPLIASLPPAARRDGATVRVSVSVLDRDGKRIRELSGRTRVRRTRPNGPDCPPVCFQARLRLGTAGQRS